VTAPFYNAIKGTTSGAPGTGAFTPNAASSGFRAWANVPAGWIGLVRFDDGTSWELSFCYWSGTTLSRSATQLYDSSSGSAISLTSAATAAMVVDASEVMSHIGGTQWRAWVPVPGTTTIATYNLSAPTGTGTASSATLAASSYRAEQNRIQYASATTANAQAGWSNSTVVAVYSTASGRGGFECVARFGAAQLPTGPRLLVGLSTVTFVGSTAEPSALAASVAGFCKDSTDTNVQFFTKDGTTANKVDTGITLNATDFYEASVWAEPGGGRVYGLLINLATGAIWFGSTTSNLPANGALMLPQLVGGLNGTNTGTAFQLQIGSYMTRNGA
jgi:hypothetical protein